MNPLTWPAPSFLLFYSAVGVTTLGVLWVLRRKREGGRLPHLKADDPYLITYLRGGETEVARIAVLSLIHRGLLTEQGKNVVARVGNAFQGPAVEATIIRLFATPRSSMEVLKGTMTVPCMVYERELRHRGLLPDTSTLAARTRQVVLAVAILLGLAIARVALGSGGPIIFLALLAIVFCWLCTKVVSRRRTARGDDALDGLQQLFRPGKERAAIAGGSTNTDLTLLIALFGLSALSVKQFAYAKRIFDTPRANDGGGCGGGGTGDGGGCGGCGGE